MPVLVLDTEMVDQRRQYVKHPDHPQACSAEPRGRGTPRPRLGQGDRQRDADDDVARHEVYEVIQADVDPVDVNRVLEVVAAVAGVEQRLVDHTGLEDAECGGQQQNRRPPTPCPPHKLASQQRGSSVHRTEEHHHQKRVRERNATPRHLGHPRSNHHDGDSRSPAAT